MINYCFESISLCSIKASLPEI